MPDETTPTPPPAAPAADAVMGPPHGPDSDPDTASAAIRTVPDGLGDMCQQLHALGVLIPADLHVAETLGRLGGEDDHTVLLAAALATRAPRHGHVCIELDRVAERVVPADETPEAAGIIAELPWPALDAWQARLRASSIVRDASDHAAAGADGDAASGDERDGLQLDRSTDGESDEPRVTPLVLDGRRLYLDRYWRYQARLAHQLRGRATAGREDVEPAAVRRQLDELFPSASGDGALDRQQLAAALTALRDLTVISGGPGTGKTTTIVRLLALLLSTVEVAARPGGRPQIALAAPTGKAAVRMQEAVREALDTLPVGAEIKQTLAELEAKTLHRLLGWQPRNPTRFRHDADHPLPYDVLVVDEASMVSLSLMAKLVDAVPPGARLILVGDRNQLASVEAGAVLGDICGPTRAAGGAPLQLSAGVRDALVPVVGEAVADAAQTAEQSGIWDSIVHLTRFYRFGPESGIGAVARAVQAPDQSADDIVAYLRGQRTVDDPAGRYDDVALAEPHEDGALPEDVRSLMANGYQRYVESVINGDEPTDVLNALGAQRVLCAVRRGPQGVAALNTALERLLAARVPDFEPVGPWYLGRPVMVTQNDYGVRLFNGDVGVVVRDPEDPARKVVAFPTVEGEAGVRFLSPSRLPPCETVFATTIHKSQGSQFGRVFVVLPTVSSPILTRELVYTAITRARQHVTVVAREALLREALARPIQRASGLEDALWG